MKKTCLHSNHTALGALMSPFGGFDMPISYEGIEAEHRAVREGVGVLMFSTWEKCSYPARSHAFCKLHFHRRYICT